MLDDFRNLVPFGWFSSGKSKMSVLDPCVVFKTSFLLFSEETKLFRLPAMQFLKNSFAYPFKNKLSKVGTNC